MATLFLSFCVILMQQILSSSEFDYFGCHKFNGYDSIDEYYQVHPDIDRINNEGAAVLSKRVNLTDAANNDGAVCIDGSVPVFYWRRGVNDGINKFLIYFDGGGWCGGIDDDHRLSPCQDSCVHRATDQFGTSNGYKEYADNDKGCMSTNKYQNPLSYNWNIVVMMYCDGSSFNGNNDTVIKINDDITLHFRGWRILNGLFKELISNKEYDLSKATDVIIGGCSAGALNLYMHLDYIHDTYIPKEANFMGLIDSGFFMEYEGDGKYITAMRWLWDWMNVTDGMNKDCMEYYKKQNVDEFECMFAENLAPFINVKTFNMQSRFDEWQDICELMSFDENEINKYGNNLTNVFQQMYENSNGNNNNNQILHGAFLDSCYRHCDDGNWHNVTIDGYNASTAIYQFYYNETSHSRIWFQNDTYPCATCC